MITNLRMELFEALMSRPPPEPLPAVHPHGDPHPVRVQLDRGARAAAHLATHAHALALRLPALRHGLAGAEESWLVL